LIFHFDLRLTFRTEMTWLVLPVSLVSILGITFLCQALARFNWPWLAYLGQASLVIYVMHILVAAGVRVFSSKALGISSPGFLLAAGVMTGIIVPLLIRGGIKRSGWRLLYRPMGITD